MEYLKTKKLKAFPNIVAIFKMNSLDSSSIALHLKTHSILKSKFRKILFENTTIIAQEIPEALHMKINPRSPIYKNKTKNNNQ